MVQLQRLAIAMAQISNRHIDLTAEQQHYLGRVLRLRQGDRFIVIDGQGHWWLAQLQVMLPAPSPHAEILEAISVQNELPIEVKLWVSLPKTGFDDLVRYCTELGVSEIVPVISQRTVLKPSLQKVERWRRIIREAVEQSERQIIPTLVDPISFVNAIADSPDLRLTTTSQPYICVARGDLPHLYDCMSRSQSTCDSITLATGPEGGWTSAEVEMAIASGFQAVSLGQRILRAVTAPVVALSYVSAIWETATKPENHSSV
ncbi:RNA methyltransferase, RsmE family protein [Lyngbya aestuarii BL J]|mgnify:CR=1 FL=1|uniref:Ribosomal RNA small subunit methyltransferase E n=1 Tax=Lyngbya aestuarii BL J TaxID=1348334 RepID=U7QDA9_9CYAN|nr:16S rRNA (uracil(1498)-N(3))-methyltransferase [Lyngbya aestuarii]ERT05859.1 RNA methyltransferase, RsmE family protein [Lyngbya aestuarii BL J]